ncbi:quercetin 2,3-dioxygenase [Kushneria phyllosphaerae]|uniref:Quercetin 2,3-dioxygenase n=1 Tax=Kushneria phyllosphaerae TaxID=2100822 RepID=A0A2R8CLJ0_9GAMM|nr:quercetin 2,3-dioxygenase [Kushneria phyllosphaerae]SPJ33777.1 Quercetin 2,3-dioxygenase [Kushneria phyllosphaerae]
MVQDLLPNNGDSSSESGPVSGAEAALLANGTLPGRKTLYALRDGEGEHHLIGGQVVTLIARAGDTGGLHEAAIMTGGKGATMAPRYHAESDAAILVLDGSVTLLLDGEYHLLNRGDYAYVPAGTVYGHTMLDWRTRFLTWTIGDRVGAMYPALGTPFSRPVQPENANLSIADETLRAAEAVADVVFVEAPKPADVPERVTNDRVPTTQMPYVLRAGTGERLVAAEQLFSFMQTQASSGDQFIAIMNEGPKGDAIPPHFHREHTENFFCMDGHMTMWVNGQEVKLLPGDYVQVPARHVHAYRLDAPYTRFFGWLTPGVFEPFFRYLGDAYDGHVFPMAPPPFRFERVLAHLDELDLQPLGKGDAPASS